MDKVKEKLHLGGHKKEEPQPTGFATDPAHPHGTATGGVGTTPVGAAPAHGGVGDKVKGKVKGKKDKTKAKAHGEDVSSSSSSSESDGEGGRRKKKLGVF